MFGRLLALFLITPVVELALLIQVGDIIGFFPTIGLIVATGLAGSYLARREGLSVWRRFNNRLREGDLPGQELVDGMIILVAGALLITPGVLTDVIGFLGLVPLTRGFVRRCINSRIRRAMEKGTIRLTFGGFQTYRGAFDAEDGWRATGDSAADDLHEPGWQGERRERPERGNDR